MKTKEILNKTNIMNTENEMENMVATISSETHEAVLQFYKGWKTNDLSIIDTLFSPDWQDIPMAPGQKEGPEGMKNLINFFNESFPDVEITVKDIFGTANRIAVRAQLTFTHDKEFMGIAPVNQKVKITMLELHHLQDGKITHTWHVEDWFGLLMQSRSGGNN